MEKINSSNNVKQALAHMPLILVCMEVLFSSLIKHHMLNKIYIEFKCLC